MRTTHDTIRHMPAGGMPVLINSDIVGETIHHAASRDDGAAGPAARKVADPHLEPMRGHDAPKASGGLPRSVPAPASIHLSRVIPTGCRCLLTPTPCHPTKRPRVGPAPLRAVQPLEPLPLPREREALSTIRTAGRSSRRRGSRRPADPARRTAPTRSGGTPAPRRRCASPPGCAARRPARSGPRRRGRS